MDGSRLPAGPPDEGLVAEPSDAAGARREGPDRGFPARSLPQRETTRRFVKRCSGAVDRPLAQGSAAWIGSFVSPELYRTQSWS
jgi:hypothetical protein